MTKITFYPLGNADCCLIAPSSGKRILFDYADRRDPNDEEDKRCDLPKELRDDLEEAERDYYDVVAFTHLDEDHYKGATEFFWLRHAEKYQSDERIKIDTLWVPAALLIEDDLDKEEAKILQAEARYRFKQGEGIRVFSRPGLLKEWCSKNGVSLDERRHLVTDAGNVAPEFILEEDGVEFFVHSPFAKRVDENEVINRNTCSIVMQAVFEVNSVQTKMLLMGDATHDVLADIVDVTKYHEREERLEWDIVKLPHHCSYLSLGTEKGSDKTEPVEQATWLYEEQKKENAIVISTSKPIPSKGSDEDEDQNPPHRQAANYYKGIVDDPANEFKVTMEHPTENEPKPLVIEIDESKATIKKRGTLVGAGAFNTRAPRAG